MNIGERLKEERERIGLSQTALAQIGGVGKTTQIKYEKGSSRPDSAYLSAVSEEGIDIFYVLKGLRFGTPEAQPLGMPLSDQGLIDVDQLVRIAKRLDAITKEAGKRMPTSQLVEIAADIYNYFQHEEGVEDDEKLARTLKLVINR
ncbi:helix-turn-helix transcriptional regulator [Halomonas sp. 15WGF]|jgi:transcriptional regulator with XRE-family HTH domain|uniref:helix-turn-helix domain-containing protein n=1 Tax=Halomonas sp. 15WGF TaxID=2570357 RepID=UPI001BB0489A|nr:helix-turn-helix transcriptional regulator [Halomonas sp. 15WGF]|tara:strand:- start:4684 stop:5121 length:438 start_codon:yes stop_codon:yes gene_type:complete